LNDMKMKASAIRGNSARKIYAVSIAVCFTIVLFLILSLPPLTPPAASSESLGDYFKISYDPATFSKTDILGNEAFSVTIHGNATCINNLPLTVREGRITGEVVSVHSVSGRQVILQSTYTVNINPFPSKQGQSTDMTATVPLQFPASAEAGQYSVTARTIKAEVYFLGNWSDVTDMFPASVVLGTLTYTSSAATPTPVATATPAPAATTTPAPAATTTPTPTPTSTPIASPSLPISQMVLNIGDAEMSLWDIDANGLLLEDAAVNSAGGEIRLHIPAGTKALGADGTPLTELTVMAESTPPSPDEGFMILASFDFSPDGAIFTPRIELTISYDPYALPAGFDETKLAVAYFDEDRGEWEYITGMSIDTANHTATFSIGHFTVFAVLVPTGSTTDTGSDTDILPWIIIGSTFVLGLALVILVLKRLRIQSKRTVISNRNRTESNGKM
jgi:hypothetical protein